MKLKELAECCGTTVGTVSKAFSGARDVSKKMREHIFSVAKEQGCFDKYYKGPRDRKLIALMFPESESEYYGREIGYFERELSARGADSVIILTRFDRERTSRFLNDLAYRMHVDGIILDGSSKDITIPEDIPFVNYATQKYIKSQENVIDDGFLNCIYDTVALIKEYGHRTVGYIGEPLTWKKVEVLKGALRSHGLPVLEKFFITVDARFAKAGELGMRALIESGEIPDVIIGAYDQIAYGAMQYAKSVGYNPPEDVSFIGIDDIMVNEYLDVPLTSIHYHTDTVCKEIVDMLFSRIEKRPYHGKKDITIPVTLSLRASLADKRDRRQDSE